MLIHFDYLTYLYKLCHTFQTQICSRYLSIFSHFLICQIICNTQTGTLSLESYQEASVALIYNKFVAY